MIVLYPVVPVPAPRQVARDKFKPGRGVKRYRAYRDLLQILHASCPQPFHHVLFLLPMPPSWKRSQVEAQYLEPHQQTPDRDNLEKAFLDSCFANDCEVWNGQSTKLWYEFGAILVADRQMDLRQLIETPCRIALRQAYLDSTVCGLRALHLIPPLVTWLERT